MDSRILSFLIVALSACSQGQFDKGLIGQGLTKQSGLYDSYGIETKKIFVVDETSKRILGLNTETMQFEHEFELSNPNEKHYLVTDINEKFLIDFSLKHIQVIGLDGNRYDSTLKFLGTPVSAAFNSSTRTMVMQDDLSSVGILRLAANGAIEKSWLGGSLVADGKKITAGDLDKSDRMILTMSDGTISLINIDATLTQQAWSSSSFASGISSPNWLAPDQSIDDNVLIASDNELGVLNVATQKIGGKASIPQSKTSQLIGLSKAGKPHAIIKTSASSDPVLYFIASDGKLKSQILPNAKLGEYEQSYLKPDASELVLLLQTGGDEVRALGLRLSDNLVIHDKTTTLYGSAKINNKFLFVDYESGLGRLDLHNLTDDTTKTVEGYNFDYLRNK